MNLDAKIHIAGHRGLVGSALMRKLQGQGYANLITLTHAELDASWLHGLRSLELPCMARQTGCL